MASCPRCGGRMDGPDSACGRCGFRFAEDPVGDFLGGAHVQSDESSGVEATDSTDNPQEDSEKLVDWMGVGVSAQENPDLVWQLQKQLRQAHNLRVWKERRTRRYRFFATVLVIVAAALGVLVDDGVFGVRADAFAERITGALLVGAFFSYFTHLLTLRLLGFAMAAFQSSQTVYYDEQAAAPKRERNPFEFASTLGFVAGLGFSTFIAAGGLRAHARSYVCILATQGALLTTLWLVYRWGNKSFEASDGTVEQSL